MLHKSIFLQTGSTVANTNLQIGGKPHSQEGSIVGNLSSLGELYKNPHFSEVFSSHCHRIFVSKTTSQSCGIYLSTHGGSVDGYVSCILLSMSQLIRCSHGMAIRVLSDLQLFYEIDNQNLTVPRDLEKLGQMQTDIT